MSPGSELLPLRPDLLPLPVRTLSGHWAHLTPTPSPPSESLADPHPKALATRGSASQHLTQDRLTWPHPGEQL